MKRLAPGIRALAWFSVTAGVTSVATAASDYYYEPLAPGGAPSWVHQLNGMTPAQRQARVGNYRVPPPQVWISQPNRPNPSSVAGDSHSAKRLASPAARPRLTSTARQGPPAQQVRSFQPNAMPVWATTPRAVPVAYQPPRGAYGQMPRREPLVHPAYGYVNPWAPYPNEAAFRAAYERVRWQPSQAERERSSALRRLSPANWRLPWAKRTLSQPVTKKAKSRSGAAKSRASTKSRATPSKSPPASLPSLDRDWSGPMLDASLFPH